MVERNPIHVAAKFKRSEVAQYDKQEVREYIQTMLKDDDILYDSILVIDNESDRMTVQVKMKKAAINSGTLDKVEGVLRALGGHLDTWILSESVMHHPEIIEV